MPDRLTIYTDGGSRGNPGPAAGAYVLLDENGTVVEGRGCFLGKTTNNVAEYTGLLEGLRAARRWGASSITVFSDSELLVRQINGQYKVKSDNLKDLFAECMNEMTGFFPWQVSHIRREQNSQADRLANQAMDAGADVEMSATSANNNSGRHLRLGVLLSGGGTTMVNLDKEIKAGRLNAEIAVVISSRSQVKGVERARKLGLEPVLIRRKDFSDIDSFSARIVAALDAARVDLVVQAGWLCLWTIPARYENRVMNIHPALLPGFGGKGMWGHHVHEAVLKAGCKVSGCTVHFADNDYDSGPIIVQRTCPVMETDDADTLAARVFEQECIAYPEAIRLFAQDCLTIVDGIVKITTS
ncbi:MAG: phosphoribosylglycinamide formyltransferase [Sedimentisphaerales bacterium]|nr:phosphoribosylglycinamide formyltransferase [Sedimentisphaerales bacterium]